MPEMQYKKKDVKIVRLVEMVGMVVIVELSVFGGRMPDAGFRIPDTE